MKVDDALSVLATPAPEFSETVAAGILQREYGLEGTLRKLVSERDQNFLLSESSGRKSLLKIANETEETRVTEFQIAALLHVEKVDPGFPVPRIRRTLNGDSHVVVATEQGTEHIVRLQSWLAGAPLASASLPADIARDMGRLLSRLDLALSSFDHPGSCYSLLWDMQHASKLRPLLPHIADIGLRRLCQQRLARFTEYTGPVIQELRKQVIYNDLNPSNLLVDSVDPRTIRGIIDFGDMVHTPLIVDVAVGAAYLCTDNPSSMSQVEQFVAGFNELHPLQDDEIDVLFELIMTRHVMTIVITHWRARQYPHNRDYILRNEPRARQTIRDLSGMQTDDVTRAFYSACRA